MITVNIGNNYAVNMANTAWLQNAVSTYFPGNIVADTDPFSNAFSFYSTTNYELVAWANTTFTYSGGLPLSSNVIRGFSLIAPNGVDLIFDVQGVSVTVGQLIAAGTTPAQISSFIYSLYNNQPLLINDGSFSNDTLVGFNAADTIYGNTGNDTIDGKGGADAMYGEEGNDTYIVDDSLDLAIENLNEGTDLVQSSASFVLDANVENLTLTGTDPINGQGNSQNNVLTGNNNANLLDGAGGADSMSGLSGNDIYVVDNAGDVVSEISPSGGFDMVQSFVSNYMLPSNVELLVLGGTGNLNGTGNSLDNALTGNSGNNLLDGLTGADLMQGGAGNDTYVVDNAGDVVTEALNEGTDTVQTAVQVSGNYTLAANVENLIFTGTGALNGTGNAVNNVMTGTSAANSLSGAGGNDTLTGGLGNDTLNGGAGFDTAVQAGLYRQYLETGNTIGSGTVQGPQGTDTLSGMERLQFVDGSLTFDPGANIAKVVRLYLATLERLPDAQGLNFWLGQLDTGTGLNVMADSFVASSEFQAKYGALSNGQFVNLVYQNVLHRNADAGGLAFWTGQLDAGLTRGQVVTGFSESAEMTTINAALFNAGLWDIDETAGSVARLYLGGLGHAPTLAQVPSLVSDIAALKGGTLNLLQEANTLTGSTEFVSAYGSLNNTDFVNQLYQNLLGRAGSAGELTSNLNLLNTGHTRGEVLLGLTESAEYQGKTIGQIDQGFAIDNGLQGTAGNDTIVGTVMSEVLKGLGGNDALSGGAGNDTLLGGPGNDSLNGGAGFDVAQYAGAFRQYLATGNAISAGTVQGPEGTDTLTGIEQLSFVDGSLTFDPSSHIAQVTRLYLATLNRLPDALGQNFWQGILDTGVGQVGLNTMAGNFVASAEFQSHYGALTNGQFVDQLYQNVLHRPADAGGLAFWTSALGAGATRGQVVVQFSESAEMTTINAALFNAGLWDIDEAAASVARLYFGALGHAPTVANLVSDVAAVKAGTLTLIQDANALTLSTEFTTAYGGLSGAAYANQLYQNLLARPASTSEQAYAASHTKSEVLLALTESQPYQLKLIGQIDHGIAASDAHFP